MRKYLLLAVVALGALSLVGCGDDDDNGDGGGGSGGIGGNGGTGGTNGGTGGTGGTGGAAAACEEETNACNTGPCKSEYDAATACAETCADAACCQTEGMAYAQCILTSCPDLLACGGGQ